MAKKAGAETSRAPKLGNNSRVPPDGPLDPRQTASDVARAGGARLEKVRRVRTDEQKADSTRNFLRGRMSDAEAKRKYGLDLSADPETLVFDTRALQRRAKEQLPSGDKRKTDPRLDDGEFGTGTWRLLDDIDAKIFLRESDKPEAHSAYEPAPAEQEQDQESLGREYRDKILGVFKDISHDFSQGPFSFQVPYIGDGRVKVSRCTIQKNGEIEIGGNRHFFQLSRGVELKKIITHGGLAYTEDNTVKLAGKIMLTNGGNIDLANFVDELQSIRTSAVARFGPYRKMA